MNPFPDGFLDKLLNQCYKSLGLCFETDEEQLDWILDQMEDYKDKMSEVLLKTSAESYLCYAKKISR